MSDEERVSEEDQDADFGTSVLGTKEYWDKVYKRELKNFEEHGDVGEVWFGIDAVEKVVDWLVDEGIDRELSILDVGCGNGVMLHELSKSGFTSLYGIDYSELSIALSKAIAEQEGFEATFAVVDFLADVAALPDQPYDISVDKGTYDAISLSENAPEARSSYIENVVKVTKPGGLVIITSCNWTEDEVKRDFTASPHLKYKTRLKYPVFEFGGKKGQTICTVVFTRTTE
eukprot:Opistho-2@69342